MIFALITFPVLRCAPLGALALVLSVTSCNPGPLPPETPVTKSTEHAKVIPILVESSSQPDAESATTAPELLFKDIGLQTPESVYYDALADRYLVSNINGSPGESDNNGFITTLSPEGGVKTLKFIAGGSSGVTLNAPKGMTTRGSVLYVADIDHVRTFDLVTGKSLKNIAVPGATFLNDMATDQQGQVYVTDSAVVFIEGKPVPRGAPALYRVLADRVELVASGNADDDGLHFQHPNGVMPIRQGFVVATFRSNVLHQLDQKGKSTAAITLPSGGLDGIVVLGEDDYLVSSWAGKAVYRGGFHDGFHAVVSEVEAPADIGFDKKRGRVLIPSFTTNQVRAVTLLTRQGAPKAKFAANVTASGKPTTQRPPQPKTKTPVSPAKATTTAQTPRPAAGAPAGQSPPAPAPSATQHGVTEPPQSGRAPSKD